MAEATAVSATSVPRLKREYREVMIPALTEKFGYKNPHQVPGLVKVVVNTGVGEAARDSKVIEGAIKDLTLITGQKPVVTTARIRDFRGLSDRQFDGNGNYTFGITEQSVFHEINQDDIDRVRGFDITIVTTAKNDDEGRALLLALGFPFAGQQNSEA